MDDTSGCTSLTAESDAQNNIASIPNAASVTDADKVINNKIDSTQVEEKSTEVHTSSGLQQDPEKSQQKPSSEGVVEHDLNPAVTSATCSTEVDLKDPNKYCALCTASFTNPHVALQHYSGRKHQRNQARQELLKQLGHNVEQGNSLMCQMCGMQFNSVEMYQDHMQGSKHQIKEKKVIDLCKSQQKLYSTFADELADYIQVQKARGITPKTNQVLPQDTMQKGDEDEEREVLNRKNMVELNKPVANLLPTSISPHQSHSGHYSPLQMGCSSFQGPPLPSRASNYNYPPPVLRNSGPPPVTNWPMRRRQRRSSSSSCTTSLSYSSSSYSSYSSSESDSDNSEYRHREKRQIKTSHRERVRRGKDEERRRKRRRRERDNDSEERRREQSVESEEERSRKKSKIHGKWRRKEKKSLKENFKVERGDQVMDKLKPEDMMKNSKETELRIQAEINVKQREGGEDESIKPKYRKEKKKAKEKADTRTEEEKLWDDSILGC
uniref:Zinc finger matrin-type protein 1 n=1 Tax=Oreochromis niloticus TaxID=8128 RepID=A0A669CXP7_ORENI